MLQRSTRRLLFGWLGRGGRAVARPSYVRALQPTDEEMEQQFRQFVWPLLRYWATRPETQPDMRSSLWAGWIQQGETVETGFMYSEVQSMLVEQLGDAITHVHRAEEILRAQAGQQQAAPGSEGAESSPESLLLYPAEPKRVSSDAVAELHGFCPEVRPSSTGGHGLFLRGHAPMGTFLGLYAGVVYDEDSVDDVPPLVPPAERVQAGEEEHTFNHNYHLVASRWDHALLDSGTSAYPLFKGGNQAVEWAAVRKAKEARMKVQQKHYQQGLARSLKKRGNIVGDWFIREKDTPELLQMRLAVHKQVRSLLAARWCHPFALAQFAKHPSTALEQEPNVLRVPIDIPMSFPVDLLPYIPNRPYVGSADPLCVRGDTTPAVGEEGDRVPMRSTMFIRTVGLIALQDIPDGVELLVNHALPHGFEPPGYEPCSPVAGHTLTAHE